MSTSLIRQVDLLCRLNWVRTTLRDLDLVHLLQAEDLSYHLWAIVSRLRLCGFTCFAANDAKQSARRYVYNARLYSDGIVAFKKQVITLCGFIMRF